MEMRAEEDVGIQSPTNSPAYTMNDQRSESTGHIILSSSISTGVLSQLTPHPDFENTGLRREKVSEPCRIVNLFEERISGPAKKIWSQRRVSMRGWKMWGDMVASKEGGKDIKTKSEDPTLSAQTSESKEHAHAYTLFASASRGVAASTSTALSRTQSLHPLRPKCPLNQVPQHATDSYRPAASPNNSPPSSFPSVVSPSPHLPFATEIQALLARIDHPTTQIQQYGLPPLLGTGSIPSLASIGSPPATSSVGPTNGLRQRRPSEQSVWTECSNRLDAVAAEAAEHTRAQLRRLRMENMTREVGVVQEAIALTPAKPTLVVNQPARNKLTEKSPCQEKLSSMPEMQERKKVGYKLPWGLEWEEAWHNPPTGGEEEINIHGIELSTTTRATTKYTLADATFRFPTSNPTSLKIVPTHSTIPMRTSNTQYRSGGTTPLQTFSKTKLQSDTGAEPYHLPLPVVRHPNTSSHRPPPTLYPPDVPASSVSYATFHRQHPSTEQLREAHGAEMMSSKGMKMESDATLVEGDESGEDWHSCYEEWQTADRDEEVKTPLLDRYPGRC
jgi:hypothetical protein